MAWNPFEHLDKLPMYNADFSHVFGGGPRLTARLPDGQEIATATRGHPETLTFWLRGADGGYDQITQDMSFVQQMWIHFTFDAPAPVGWKGAALAEIGLAHDYTITREAMLDAAAALPHVMEAMAAAGIDDDAMWNYVQAEAPWAVELVGVPG